MSAWLNLRNVFVVALVVMLALVPVYAALSYDGRVVIEPDERFDRELVAGFNLHQRTDKGFGPALGSAAAQTAILAGGHATRAQRIDPTPTPWVREALAA